MKLLMQRILLVLIAGFTLAACDMDDESGQALSVSSPASSTNIATKNNVAAQNTSTDQPAPRGRATAENVVSKPTLILATAAAGETFSKDQSTVDTSSNAPAITVYESEFDSDGDGWFTYEELEQAIASSLPDYTFPENYQTSVESIMKQWEQYKQGGAEWQSRMHITTLSMYHMCAWELAWLDAFANGNEEAMEESLGQLRSVSLEAPTLQGIRSSMTERFNHAGLGDPSLIQQHVDSSCLMEWATPQPGTPQATTGRRECSLADLDAGPESITA